MTGCCQVTCPADLPGAPLPERAAHLYACRSLSTYQIAVITGISRQRVTRLLRKSGVAVKPRGAGRRKGRQDPAAERLDALMADLYLRLRLPSTQIAELTGRPAATVGALLHASGIPLRPPGGRSPFMRRWREART